MAADDDIDKDKLKTVANQTQPETEAIKAKPTKKRRKARRTVVAGQVHIFASFNNTIITFSDNKGNALTASSAGSNGFRGSKKGTGYAAQVASAQAAQAAKNQFGMKQADVFIKGVGLGRDSAVRAIAAANIQVDKLIDVTGVPHGGVRPRKSRRV